MKSFLIISQETVKTFGLEAAREFFDSTRNTNTDSQDTNIADIRNSYCRTDVEEEVYEKGEDIQNY